MFSGFVKGVLRFLCFCGEVLLLWLLNFKNVFSLSFLLSSFVILGAMHGLDLFFCFFVFSFFFWLCCAKLKEKNENKRRNFYWVVIFSALDDSCG